jgi:signal transduction histidine kinase/CheY-like chemotaxis protein
MTMPPFLSSATLLKVGTIPVRFESDVVRARNLGSMLAQELRFDKTSSIRIGTAVSELSRNMVEHASGGKIEFFIAHKVPSADGIVITFTDQGQGIKQLSEIQSGTYVSPKGMGVGLSGSQRLMDDFHIQTGKGEGTVITIAKWLPSYLPRIDQNSLDVIKTGFSKTIERGDSSMFETISAQNNELLFLLKSIQERNDEIVTINNELEETNKGVLALNRELEEKAQAIEKEKQQAEQANKAKRDFLAHMSHEIRTPMNAILGFTDLLLKTDLNPIQKKYSQNVRIAGQALLDIINDILDFSKIEAGKLEIEIIESDVFDLLSQTIEIVKYQATKKSLELLLITPPDLPRYADVDPLRLRQILINLLNNAIKFTEKGEVILKVEFLPLNNDKAKFRFSVSDTGIGITPEQKQKLFKAFSQADGSTTRKFGGTGLGLVVSNILAGKMGSSLRLDSIWGEGSVFHFEIETGFRDAPGESSWKVVYFNALILDHNQNNLNNFSTHLRYWNVKHTVCDNATDALLLLQKGIYDIFIGNSGMLDQNSMTKIKRVRINIGPEPHVPLKIVMLYDTPEKAELSEEYQADSTGYNYKLVKPVMMDDLLAVLSHNTDQEDKPEFHGKKEGMENDIIHSINNISGKKTILIAEDVEMNMFLIKMIIRNIIPEIDIIEAVNGRQAVEIAGQRTLNLIFMDVQMPEMDGIEATQNIRRLKSETTKNLPIIALTASAIIEEREKALNAGMNDFLTKPIDIEQLKSVLSKYLG